MFAHLVRYNVGHSFREPEAASVAEFAQELAVEAMNNVSKATPMIGSVSFAVSNQAYPKAGKLDGLPCRSSCFTRMLSLTNFVPVDCGEWNVRRLVFR